MEKRKNEANVYGSDRKIAILVISFICVLMTFIFVYGIRVLSDTSRSIEVDKRFLTGDVNTYENWKNGVLLYTGDDEVVRRFYSTMTENEFYLYTQQNIFENNARSAEIIQGVVYMVYGFIFILTWLTFTITSYYINGNAGKLNRRKEDRIIEEMKEQVRNLDLKDSKKENRNV
jgi:hypothetical protein